MLEGYHSKHRGEVEKGREGCGGETDSRRIHVAFGDDRQSDITGRERGTGGRNKERRKVVVELVHGVR